MTGYETYVILNGTLALATSADIPLDRTKIESSSIYGGSITGSSIPLHQSHYYDWAGISANLSIDVNDKFLPILLQLIKNRNVPVSLDIFSRLDGEKKITNAWWNSISIQTNEDSALTATLGFVALERDMFNVGKFSGYWENESGMITCQQMEEALNADQGNISPIPFWKTKIDEFDYVKGWTFNLTQDVVRFMGCMNHAGTLPQEPYVLGVGLMGSSFKVNTLPPVTRNDDIWAMPEDYSSIDVIRGRRTISIIIAGSTFLTLDCELNKVDDPFAGNNSIDNIDFDYSVFSFS